MYVLHNLNIEESELRYEVVSKYTAKPASFEGTLTSGCTDVSSGSSLSGQTRARVDICTGSRR